MQTQTAIHFEMTVTSSADDAYVAISQVNAWWMRNMEGSAAHVDDAFVVRFGNDGGFVRFVVTDASPDSRYVWHVQDCLLPWLTDKTEWNGTDVIFEIVPHETGCTMSLVHRGITPAVECYTACAAGWGKFFNGSLHQLLTEGVGTPQ